jgi:hypothetical protein
VSERKRVHVDKDCQHFIAEPPAAHPPEGSQPPDCPNCDGVEGMHTLRSCLSPPTPPPGPGQDVEAQARPVEALAKLLQEAGAELVISLTGSEWREVLRAAQAEAERRLADAEMCDGCGRVPPVPDDGRCGCHGEGRSGMLRHARIVLQKTQDALEAAERRAQEAERLLAVDAKSHIEWRDEARKREATLEAQVRSAREAALREASDAIEMLERNMNYGPSVADALAVLRALSSSPVSSQSEPKA